MTAADVLYGLAIVAGAFALAIVAGAFALVAAEDLLAAWARSRSMRAILGRRHAENTRGRAEKRAAQRVPAVAPLMSICHPTMPDPHRDVKPENVPHRAAGGMP